MLLPDKYGRKIPLPEGKRWVIGDIHGCYKTFRALLSRIELGISDQLFLLGDYVNKGPASLKVLLALLELGGSNIFPLIGNHDKLFLDYLNDPSSDKRENLEMLNAMDLLEADASTQNQLSNFLAALPYYYISGNLMLVHAGFNFNREDVFSDRESMITIKNFKYDPSKVSGKKIVHGHFPTPLKQITRAVIENQPVIPLDNGCVYQGDAEGMGNLIGLELNERRLIVQPNLDHT